MNSEFLIDSSTFNREKIIKAVIGNIKVTGRKKELLIVSTGGVLTPEDVFERLSLGANLVQVYSALVFSGPNFFQNVSNSHKQIRGN